MGMKKVACVAIVYAAASLSAVLAAEEAVAAAAPSPLAAAAGAGLEAAAGEPAAGPAGGAAPTAEAPHSAAVAATGLPFMAVSLVSTFVAYLLH
ncbi:unnamed protein product [Linum trigynum]|uniref:Uncharacterized protein n=1 Tax=Linum trigynum TaxID=586398 RepID=A0AAV2E1E2_9ROSI